MKILTKLIDKSGKLALSALQMGGLAAVVGVAGIATWNMVNSSSDNTAFNPSMYEDEEVVFVAQSGGQGSSARNSAVEISGRTMQLRNEVAQRNRVNEEMAEYGASYESAAPAAPVGYQMGMTEGLGMGSNFAVEQGSREGSSAAQNPLAGMQDMIAQVQTQAQAQAAAQGGLAGATVNKAGGAGGSGSAFAVQNSGKNAGGLAKQSGGVGVDSAGNGPTALSLQEEAARMLGASGARGRSSFGPDSGLGSGRNGSTLNGRASNSRGASDLEFIRKRSAEVAKNKFRSANEAGRSFLASAQNSGGLVIETESGELATGQGQHIRDFDTPFESQRVAINDWLSGVSIKEEQRQENKNDMQSSMWWAMGISVGAALVILFCGKLPPWGTAAAGVATLVALGFLVSLIDKLIDYQKAWGWDDLCWWALATIAGGIGVMALAWISGWKEIAKAINEWSQKAFGKSLGEAIKETAKSMMKKFIP